MEKEQWECASLHFVFRDNVLSSISFSLPNRYGIKTVSYWMSAFPTFMATAGCPRERKKRKFVKGDPLLWVGLNSRLQNRHSHKHKITCTDLAERFLWLVDFPLFLIRVSGETQNLGFALKVTIKIAAFQSGIILCCANCGFKCSGKMSIECVHVQRTQKDISPYFSFFVSEEISLLLS